MLCTLYPILKPNSVTKSHKIILSMTFKDSTSTFVVLVCLESTFSYVDRNLIILVNYLSIIQVIIPPLLIKKYIVFPVMCMCESACGYVHMSAGTCGVQNRAADPLELELQAVVTFQF